MMALQKTLVPPATGTRGQGRPRLGGFSKTRLNHPDHYHRRRHRKPMARRWPSRD
jgi:hypothetical protein